MSPDDPHDLRERIAAYLAAHHTMTVATAGPLPGAGPEEPPGAPAPASEVALPHAASVFYVMDGDFDLVFLSKPTSLHGGQIGECGPVAVTVTEDYADWQQIQGVQLWGRAHLLSGVARIRALTLYAARFPFLRDMIKQPHLAELLADIGVYLVVAQRVAFTDNTTGVFGREILDICQVQ